MSAVSTERLSSPSLFEMLCSFHPQQDPLRARRGNSTYAVSWRKRPCPRSWNLLSQACVMWLQPALPSSAPSLLLSGDFMWEKGQTQNLLPFSSWLGYFYYCYYYYYHYYYLSGPIFLPSVFFPPFFFILWFALARIMWTFTALGVWQKIFKDAGLVLLVWLLSFYLGANTVNASDRSGRTCSLPSGPHSQSQHLFVCVCVCVSFFYLFIFFLIWFFSGATCRKDVTTDPPFIGRVSSLLQQNAEGNTT